MVCENMWTYETGTFKDFIKEMTKPIPIAAYGLTHICIKHCYRGNPSSGRLWSIWSDGSSKWIVVAWICKLKSLGYKWSVSTEENLPTDTQAVDCPLKYLDMVPCPAKNKNAAEWRGRVYEYHNNRVAKRLAKKAEKKKEGPLQYTLQYTKMLKEVNYNIDEFIHQLYIQK